MDINDTIAANVGLVYSILNKFRLRNDPDAESFAYEALYNAVLTYDEKKGPKFSTYASCVIANSLRMHLRTLNKKRQLDIVSYNTPVSSESDTMLVDTLSGIDTTETIAFTNDLRSRLSIAINKVLDTLSDGQRKIVLIWQESDYTLKQADIAQISKLSQASVSRTIKIFKYRLQLELEDYLC